MAAGIAAITEQNAAAAEEVSAAVEEVNAVVEQVAGWARTLAEIAEDHRRSTRRFQLTGDGARPAPADRGLTAVPDPAPAGGPAQVTDPAPEDGVLARAADPPPRRAWLGRVLGRMRRVAARDRGGGQT